MKRKIPAWLSDALFYEIYPQSFYDTNGDGIGDFEGIRAKLDYIKDLGFNAIWMNPCFDSPFGDAGYDVRDYKLTAERYGTNDDLKRLIDDVHAHGMHLILDLVPGHTSIEHKWFLESMKPERNEYTDRYVWTDEVWTEPRGLNTIRGISDRDGSCVVNFFSMQPALNYGFYEIKEPWQQSMDDEGPRATLDAMIDVIRFWLDLGCDGFRVDMAGSLVKGDPEAKGTIALWNRTFDMINKEYPDAAFISEWGEPDRSIAGGFHMDFLLHFGPSHYNDLFRCEKPYFNKAGEGDITAFAKKYLSNYNKTNGEGLICIPSGNHDMFRLARRLDTDDIKIAFSFLLSMPGAPFVYYGDEIGMRHYESLTSVEGGYYRTGARTPMQWDDTKNAGFSSADPEKLYISIDPDEHRPTVKDQLKNSDSVLNEMKRLIKLRFDNPALHNTAKIEFLRIGYPLIYRRKCDEQSIICVINPSDREIEVRLPSDKCLYKVGAGLVRHGDKLFIGGSSSVFIEE